MTGNFVICRGCGRQILFIKTKSGAKMPCNPELIQFYPKEHGSQHLVTPDGDVVSGELTGNGEPSFGYVSHFATCPGASKFRRKK